MTLFGTLHVDSSSLFHAEYIIFNVKRTFNRVLKSCLFCGKKGIVHEGVEL